MRRREFVALFGGAAVGWPLAVRAQQSAMPVIGFLRSASAASSAPIVRAFHQGLKEAGFVETQNVAIEYRYANNQNDRLATLAADLVRRQCAVIIGSGSAAALAAKVATATIPIVFSTGEDPVKIALVASLNRPGGNVTGVAFYTTRLGSKQLELLREVAPNAAVIGVLINLNSPDVGSQTREAQGAARALGQQLFILNVRSANEFDMAFATLAQHRAGALLVAGDALFFGNRNRLVALAARHAVPAIYDLREYVAAGGLMSYGASITDAYRQTGIYAGRVLKGAKPAELPVMQPTKFQLVINQRTAKALGLKIPDKLLFTADEVIE